MRRIAWAKSSRLFAEDALRCLCDLSTPAMKGPANGSAAAQPGLPPCRIGGGPSGILRAALRDADLSAAAAILVSEPAKCSERCPRDLDTCCSHALGRRDLGCGGVLPRRRRSPTVAEDRRREAPRGCRRRAPSRKRPRRASGRGTMTPGRTAWSSGAYEAHLASARHPPRRARREEPTLPTLYSAAT